MPPGELGENMYPLGTTRQPLPYGTSPRLKQSSGGEPAGALAAAGAAISRQLNPDPLAVTACVAVQVGMVAIQRKTRPLLVRTSFGLQAGAMSSSSGRVVFTVELIVVELLATTTGPEIKVGEAAKSWLMATIWLLRALFLVSSSLMVLRKASSWPCQTCSRAKEPLSVGVLATRSMPWAHTSVGRSRLRVRRSFIRAGLPLIPPPITGRWYPCTRLCRWWWSIGVLNIMGYRTAGGQIAARQCGAIPA